MKFPVLESFNGSVIAFTSLKASVTHAISTIGVIIVPKIIKIAKVLTKKAVIHRKKKEKGVSYVRRIQKHLQVFSIT